MQSIQLSEFKARCLALVDAVANSGEVLILTRDDRPVAEIHPYSKGRSSAPFGLHSEVQILGDVVSAQDEDDWDVLK